MTAFVQTDFQDPGLMQRSGMFRRTAALKDYGIAVAICMLILTLSLKLWMVDLNRPLSYWGDAIMVQVWNKTIYEFGWYLENPRLGAPEGMVMGDFPMADGLHQGIYKVLAWMSPNFMLPLNLFYFATFPLTTVTTLYVARKLGLGAWTALMCSLLYTYLPYHIWRHVHHYYLSSYYIVPLSILVVLWISLDEVSVFRRKTEDDPKPGKSRFLGSLLICVLQGCAGVYYGFFACYLLLVSGGMAAIQRRRFSPILTAVLFVAVTSGSLLVNLSPHLLYRLEHGPNPEVADRTTLDAEVHALKISQLVLPSPHHPIPLFADWTRQYNENSLSTHENYTSTLGTVGTLGFISLLLVLCVPMRRTEEMFASLSRLNLWAVLLGTMGGLGSLFSLFVSPMIRGYNRISVFIAFFSLLMVCFLLERFHKWLAVRGHSPWIFRSLVCAIALIGIVDQIPLNASRFFVGNADEVARWESDVEFFGRVEASMPEHAMIFQYPHLTFPEGPWVPGVPSQQKGQDYQHTSYDNGRGYLHTKTLRWSLPIAGRHVDNVLQTMSKMPLAEHLKTLALADFRGICIYRPGYIDRAAALEAKLIAKLGVAPMVSRDETMSFFDITGYVERLKQSMSAETWQVERELAWNSPTFSWRDGFYGLEATDQESWRWAQSEGEVIVDNPFGIPITRQIEFECLTGQPELATVTIESELFSARLTVNHQPVVVTETLTIPPGRHTIKFSCDAKPLEVPGDLRNLVFVVRSFRLLAAPEDDSVSMATTGSPTAIAANEESPR